MAKSLPTTMTLTGPDGVNADPGDPIGFLNRSGGGNGGSSAPGIGIGTGNGANVPEAFSRPASAGAESFKSNTIAGNAFTGFGSFEPDADFESVNAPTKNLLAVRYTDNNDILFKGDGAVVAGATGADGVTNESSQDVAAGETYHGPKVT